MVADELDYVIGVDTHLDEHVLAVIAAPSGAVVAQRSIQASARGYAAALRFAADEANGARVWAIEGTGSYGAGLARFLAGRGETVLELCSRLRRSSAISADELATRLVLRRLARRIEGATLEAAERERERLGHLRAVAPALLDEPGVGPIVAAQLIVAWSHRGRVRSEAAFARLAGVAPVPASSGKTTRHRLSRGGDRQLNRALHTVVLHRRHHDPATREYIARRTAEGKSRREATRLLKRYLARHLYRLLQNQEPLLV